MNQVGLYEKAQSVQDMQEKLEKEGLKSYTMKQDKLTAVVCGVSLSLIHILERIHGA